MPRLNRRFSGLNTLWLLCALAGAAPAGAQDRATGLIGAEIRLSPVAGSTQSMLGGELWLDVGGDFRFGGGAWALPRPAREGTLSGSGFELDFGYGGVGVEWSGLPIPATALRTIVGAGSGTTVDRATGARVDAEGFYLLEPGLSVAIPLGARISFGASAAWRWTFGVDELTRVDPDDLNGWSVGLGFRLGPF